MRETIEQAETEIKGLESRVEQVEDTLQHIGEQLERLAESIFRLEHRGDQETAQALQPSLKEKQEGEAEAHREVSELSAELDSVQSQVAEAKTQNAQSQAEIAALQSIGENVQDELGLIRERDTALRLHEQRILALRERLGGVVAADSAAYVPRVAPPLSERIKWVDDGIRPLEVRKLGVPEGIQTAGDFHKVSEEEMRGGILRLQEMLPAIESGAGTSSDYWAAYDKQRGLEYVNGYQRVYEAFYGQDAIRVTFDGDKHDIVNGRHRVWLAQQMGIAHLPMRVIRKVEI